MEVYKVLFGLLLAVLGTEDAVLGDCLSDDDCKNLLSPYCCKPNSLNYVCRSDCVGLSCVVDSDCGGWDEYCCNYVCQTGKCGLAGWLIAVITISVLGVVGAFIGVLLCFFCSHRRNSPGLIVNRGASCVPVTTTAVVTGSAITHGSSHPTVQPKVPYYVYGQPPPPYQAPQNYTA